MRVLRLVSDDPLDDHPVQVQGLLLDSAGAGIGVDEVGSCLVAAGCASQLHAPTLELHDQRAHLELLLEQWRELHFELCIGAVREELRRSELAVLDAAFVVPLLGV